MTTHKIDPALVKSVLRIKYEIDISVNDEQGIIEYGRTDDCNDGTSINIHEFKDKAIEYLAGKGLIFSYHISSSKNLGVLDVYFSGKDRPPINASWGKHKNGHYKYKDRLTAELAAISFCWEQIQKEKKDEND